MIGAIVLNGEKYEGEIDADYIIATDGGYDKCGGKCDLIVGDMDSVTSEITVASIVLNPEKDLTDGEYAVQCLIDKGVTEVRVYGLDGGRLDHILANIGLLSQLTSAGVKATSYCNGFTGYMVDSVLDIEVAEGAIISLSPFTDEVHIISLRGVQWILADAIISRASSLTMSNIATENRLVMKVERGQVFVIVNH